MKLKPSEAIAPIVSVIGIYLVLAICGIAGILQGCATIAPGADPLVVRVEQGESTASATFDLVLNQDNSNRAFWMTNAPVFHVFCEWLRTPTTYTTSTLPRCVVIQLSVDDLKVAYQSSKTASNSNALWTAWGTLSAALAQAQSWAYIVTNNAPK